MKLFTLLLLVITGAAPITQAWSGEPEAGSNVDTNFFYLGVVGSKAFYFENVTVVSQSSARSKCLQMGMKMARIDSVEEIDWLNTKIPPDGVSTGNPWTDGEIRVRPNSFQWASDGSSLSTDLQMDVAHTCAVHLFAKGKSLLGYDENTASKTLCYLKVNGPGRGNDVDRSPILEVRNHDEHNLLMVHSQMDDCVGCPKTAASVVEKLHVSNETITTAGFAFLGQYASKTYYIDRELTYQDHARVNCTRFGLKLAKLDSQAEMVWLSGVTQSTDALLWTDGVPRQKDASIFKWVAEDEPLSGELDGSISIWIGTRLAFRRGSQPKLVNHYYDSSSTVRSKLRYLCHSQ